MIKNETDAMDWILINCPNPDTLEHIPYDWIIIKKKPTKLNKGNAQ